ADVFGNPSVPFEGTYSTDIGDVPFPTPLRSVRPSNSLIYQEVATGILNSAKDEDTFHLLIDPAQTISVIVNPAAAVQPAVDLYVVVDGEPIFLDTAPPSASRRRAVHPSV